MSPIFMIGTQRSGSNLLRLMLNQLTEVASPHPPHIFERMQPLMHKYGDLSNDVNFVQLIDDVCKLIEYNPVEWQSVLLDRNDIYARCNKNERCLAAVYGAVYDIYAEQNGASTWCCKSLVNIHYIDCIEAYFQHPKYIYLYRDGRDVALSFQKAVVGEKHIYNIAKDWAHTQEKAIDLITHVNPDRIFCISYEELTSKTRDVANNLCKFLNVEYTDNMMDFYKTSEARNAANSSNLWGNVTNPVMSNNFGKYRTEMPANDIRIFESVAGHILDELGYKREFIKKGKELKYSKRDIKMFNRLNKVKKNEVFSNIDELDIQRRERQLMHINEIKERAGQESVISRGVS